MAVYTIFLIYGNDHHWIGGAANARPHSHGEPSNLEAWGGVI